MRLRAANRVLADFQRLYLQASVHCPGRERKPGQARVTLFLMRAFLGLIFSATLLCASGDLSNRRAPGFSLPDVQLKQHDLQDYRGKIVLIDIMQTNCPHCQRLAGILERIHGKYGEKVAILSIVNPPDNQGTVAKFAQEHKVTTPMLFDCGQVSVSYLKVTPQNPKINVPHLFVIDGQGMIRNDYGYDFDTKTIFEGEGLDVVIDKMLAAPEKSRK